MSIQEHNKADKQRNDAPTRVYSAAWYAKLGVTVLRRDRVIRHAACPCTLQDILGREEHSCR